MKKYFYIEKFMEIGVYITLINFLLNFTELNFVILLSLYAIKKVTKLLIVLAIRDYFKKNMQELVTQLIKKGGE